MSKGEIELRNVIKHLDMATMFYPRGGSSNVVRYLLRTLDSRFGISTRLLAGSLGEPGSPSYAREFYNDIDLCAADYTDAVAIAANGDDPIAHPVPLAPSFLDRPGVPDRLYCSISPLLANNINHYWIRHMSEQGLGGAEVVHLHHLTPLHESLHVIRPNGATVTTLHGTELKMMDNAAKRVRLAEKIDKPLAKLAFQLKNDTRAPGKLAAKHLLNESELALLSDGRWEHWRFADFWLETMRRYAHQTTRLVVISNHDRLEASRLLGIRADTVVQIPNGVDVDHFATRELTVDERLFWLHKWLVEEPRGWLPGTAAGSIAYTTDDVSRLRCTDGTLRPIFIFVGRFLGFKRLPLLIRSFAEAFSHSDSRPALLVWGGYPGECEGEHPYETARESGILDNVYFVGWRGHDELPLGLNCADVMIAPAFNEPFGLVYLEALSCGLPVIASASGGPLDFVVSEGEAANGWLVDDAEDGALISAMVTAADDGFQRRRRGLRGAEMVRKSYSWATAADTYMQVYSSSLAESRQKIERAGR